MASELFETAVQHGGYLTLGEIANHMGWCKDVASVAYSYRLDQGIQPIHYWTRQVERMAEGETNRLIMRQAKDLLLALEGHQTVKVRKSPVGYSATYKKWLGVLTRDDKTMTNSEVVYLGHRLSDILGGGGDRTNLTRTEAYDLYLTTVQQRQGGGYFLTPEQVEKGKSWLRRRDVLKEVRALWNDTRAVQLADTQDFRFVGYVTVDMSTSYRCTSAYKPVYQAIDSQGARTNYWASPYQDQRGSRIEIVHNF